MRLISCVLFLGMSLTVGFNLQDSTEGPTTVCPHPTAREADESVPRQKEVPRKEQVDCFLGNNRWLHLEENGISLNMCPFGATKMGPDLDADSGSNGSPIFPLNPSAMFLNASSVMSGGNYAFPGVSLQLMDVSSLNALLWTIQQQQQYQMQLLGQLQQQLCPSGFGIGTSSLKTATHRYPIKRNELESVGNQTQKCRSSVAADLSPDSVDLRRESSEAPPDAEFGGDGGETSERKLDKVTCKKEREKDVTSQGFSDQGES